MAVTKEILTLAVETGDALLRNGAEVYRVEDTVLHILKAYEITDCDVYVLSNGIFASANENKEDACSMIRHVPLGSTHLGRIAALNQLSREICSHECSLRDAWVRLEECKSIPKNKNWVEIFFCGVGSAGFCYLFGGTALDSFHCRDCRYRAVGGDDCGTFQPFALRFTGYLPAADCRELCHYGCVTLHAAAHQRGRERS